MKYDVTVRIEADSAVEALDIATGYDFFYAPKEFISVNPVKEDA